MIDSAPIGPAPVTSTRLPSSGPAWVAACRQTDKRLGESGMGQAQTRRQLGRLRLRAREHLAKPALHMREAHRAAEEAHVEAVPRLALQAVLAVAAWMARIDRDPVADRHAA